MKPAVHGDFIAAVGNTPLIRLNWASEQAGANIYGKAEFMNPGGSVKDRAALFMIRDAEKRGLIAPGTTVPATRVEPPGSTRTMSKAAWLFGAGAGSGSASCSRAASMAALVFGV